MALVCAGTMALAQSSGTYTGYTPYSVFGIGDISNGGSAYNSSMGGVGIATRNKKFINYLNPAAITAKDSLSFMADISVFGTSKFYKQADARNVTNAVNLNNLAISFPIYRSSAVVLGIAPYSSTGYGFNSHVEDPSIIGYTGDIVNSSYGQGTMYQLFAGAGATFWRRLSVGVEYLYYFGDITKSTTMSFTDASFNGIKSGFDLDLHASTAKLGLQYEQPLGGGLTLGLGATYTFSANVKGYITDYQYSSGSVVTDTLRHVVDTLGSNPGKVKLASELGVGISLRSGDKWRAEFDYTLSDWSNTGMESVIGLASESNKRFSATTASSYRAGFEITPNVNDIRYYYRRCTYRVGAYHQNLYYKLDGHRVTSTGLTFGATLPIFRLYNGLTIAVDLGQKGTVGHGMIRERYATFTVGFNLHDLWFQKHRYN